jgi:hypothetical protein
MARRVARAACLLAALAVLLPLAHAAFVVEQGSLTLESPSNSVYAISVANFGRSIYGGTLRCAAAPLAAAASEHA